MRRALITLPLILNRLFVNLEDSAKVLMFLKKLLVRVV